MPANQLSKLDPVHLPDKQFVDWCAESYLINRGVFNVIDSWFFENGVQDVIRRRKIIILFLNYLKANDNDLEDKKFLKFGKGGVKNSLQNFVNESVKIPWTNQAG